MTTNAALWWIIPEETYLKKLPSRKQLTIQQDLRTRQSIYEFTIRLGLALKVSGKTILAATVYVARFYIRMPITTSKYYVVCAALSILCKINDNYRPPDKIALVAAQIKNPNKALDEHSGVFWTWRDQLLYREELLLRTLNFELNLELPYELRDSLLEAKNASTVEKSAGDSAKGINTFKGDSSNSNGSNRSNVSNGSNSNGSNGFNGVSDTALSTNIDPQELDLALEEPLIIDIDIENDPLDQQPSSPAPPLPLSNDEQFTALLDSLTKDAIVLVEILALLPILVSYPSNAFFGVALVLTVYNKEGLSHIPSKYLQENVCELELCYKCYKYIHKLLKLGENSNPQLESNRLAAKRVPILDREQFFAVADPQKVQEV